MSKTMKPTTRSADEKRLIRGILFCAALTVFCLLGVMYVVAQERNEVLRMEQVHDPEWLQVGDDYRLRMNPLLFGENAFSYEGRTASGKQLMFKGESGRVEYVLAKEGYAFSFGDQAFEIVAYDKKQDYVKIIRLRED